MNKTIFFALVFVNIGILIGLGLVRVSNHSEDATIATTLGKTSPPLEFATSYGGSFMAITGQENLVYIGEGAALKILDISDPSNPVQLSRLPLPDMVQAIFIQADFAYIANSYRGLQIVDVQNPTHPILVGNLDTLGNTLDVIVVEGKAYLADGYEGLQIIDVSNPATPLQLGNYPVSTFVARVEIKQNTAYLGGLNDPLIILDVSDPAEPSLIQEVIELDILDFTLVGNYGYFTGGSAWGLSIYDVTNPGAPEFISRYEGNPEQGERVFIQNNIAYILTPYGITLIDANDPSTLVYLNSIQTFSNAYRLYVDDQHALISQIENITIMDVHDPKNLVEIGVYKTLPAGGIIQVVGNTAYMASASGLGVFDVTNPLSPTLVGRFPVSGGITDLDYQNGLAYLATRSQGLKIVDVSDPISPTFVGSYSGGDIHRIEVHDNLAYTLDFGLLEILDISTPISPTLIGSFTGVRDFVISDTILYGVDMNILKSIDISNPSSPTLVGSYIFPDPIPVKPIDITIFDHFVYLTGSSDETKMYIVNVTDPTNPMLVGIQSLYSYRVQVQGIYLFASSGVADQNLHVFDLTNPQMPRLRGTYTLPVIFSNVQVIGDLLYLGDNGGGLQILRIHPESFPPDIFLPILQNSSANE